MLRGVHFEDVIKSVVGLAILAAAMVAFGPGLLERYGTSVDLPPTSSPNLSNEHEIALKIEADLPKADVLNIRTLEDRVLMTLLDNSTGDWTDEELGKLINATFYLVDLAREGELPIVSELWYATEAVTVESQPVEIFIHNETFVCDWSVIKYYDGTNATNLIQNCSVHSGFRTAIKDEEIAWIGRGE